MTSIELQFPDKAFYILYAQSAGAELIRPIAAAGHDVLQYFSENEAERARFFDVYCSAQLSYAKDVLKFVGSPRSILDIGCGLGVATLYLQQATGARLIMLDSSEPEAMPANGGWHESYQFTAQLEATREFLELNGVARDNIQCIDIRRQPFPTDPVDLVVSKRSWGFHYPIETYLQAVTSILSDRGKLIVDVRKGTTGEDVLKRTFNTVHVLRDEPKARTLACALA